MWKDYYTTDKMPFIQDLILHQQCIYQVSSPKLALLQNPENISLKIYLKNILYTLKNLKMYIILNEDILLNGFQLNNPLILKS